MAIVRGVVDWYTNLMAAGDSRVQNWMFMGGPGPTITICTFYVLFVKWIGPFLMRNRPPLNIRWLMIFYNSAMVVISTYIFLELGFLGWFQKYNWKCQPVDYTANPDATAMAHLAWWYYLTKFLEFTDTIFFVLRKKFTHISTLHVIHHGIMPMSVWWGVKFTPGGHSTFFAFVNCLVHIVMYFYYALAAIGPSMNKYLWWKKYMTAFQMVQFIAIFVHSFQLLFRECNYPRGFMWWIGFHAVLFWFLFADFYKNAYGKKKLAAAKLKESLNGSAAYMNGESKSNGIISNGYSNGKQNGICKQNGVGNGMNGSNGYHKPTENGVKNGVSNGHSNGIVHRTTAKSEHEN
ncbi:elongation of very long chain fatty acids protein AAEL008004-like [Uloborus diversus]|uniref:elongation of very long chain fatty acids protein AAEL008004-like n=1 Tax=Uloborus diversus TaxID=327109 RepID=UPI002409B0B8|nr:elongation of very long chain fatty acids protein AAEL008004-like [Uloborus diversus]